MAPKTPMPDLDKALLAAATDWVILLVPVLIFLFLVLSQAWILNVDVNGYGITQAQ